MLAAAASQLTAVSCRTACSRRQAAAGPSALLRPAAAAAAAAARPAAAAPRRGGSSSSAPRGRGRLLVCAAVKVQKGKQMLCSKTLRAKEGHEAQVEELCRKVADFSRQRMADRSSGVLAFELSQDEEEGGVWHFMELYTSQAALVEHSQRPEVRAFADQVHAHLEGGLGMALYEYRDGMIGPAGMEGDVKGEGGLDDATGTNKFGGGASMRQTSSVVDLTKIKEQDDEEKGLWGMGNFKLPDWITGKKDKK